MRRKLFLIAIAVLAFQLVCAQNYFSDGNVGNAVVLRDPARQSSTEIDAVIFNPAGTSWLNDGFHISLSGIAAWKSIDSRVVGYDKEYNVKNLNITPSIQLAYKKGDWTFSASFASEGGYGKFKSENGIGFSEAMLGNLIDMFNTNFGRLKTIYELSNILELVPELNLSMEDELKLNSSDYKARLNNWTTRIGASYKFYDWLSGYIGLKFNQIHYSYRFNLTTEIVRPSTNASFEPEGYFTEAIDELNASSIQSEYSQYLGELLESYRKICGLYDEYGNILGTPVSFNQWGLSPIVSINAHFDKFNFGAKYEFQSIALNDIDERFNSIKTPAELSLGASWQATKWLKVAVGSNIYFKTSYLGLQCLSENTHYALSGSLTFNLPKNWIISGGYSLCKAADIYEALLDVALSSNIHSGHIFSMGLGYNVNDQLQLNIGASICNLYRKISSNVNYESEEDLLNTNFQMQHDMSLRTTVGIGLNYSF